MRTVAFLDFKTPRRRSLLFDASDQTKHLEESAILCLIRGARTGAADAGSCADSQCASKKCGGKKRARKKALGWAKPLAGPLATRGWGLAAATALGIAVLSSRDDDAPQRFAALFSSLRSQEQPAAHSFDAETAARQLAQAVRSLADDRDKLATRLNALDHEMRDMSGAIKQQRSKPPRARPSKRPSRLRHGPRVRRRCR
jgi:hypothetical protein